MVVVAMLNYAGDAGDASDAGDGYTTPTATAAAAALLMYTPGTGTADVAAGGAVVGRRFDVAALIARASRTYRTRINRRDKF